MLLKGIFTPIAIFSIVVSAAFAGWVKEDIDTGSGKTSIVLDSSGNPHVAYGGVKYGYKDVSGWHIETVDSGSSPVLTLDSQDRPHISYKSGTNLKYAYYNGSDWIIESVETGGSDSTIKTYDNDYPIIGHYDSSNNRIKYAYKNASGWYFYSYDSPIYEVSITIDDDLYLHATYIDGFDVMYLFFNGLWTSEFLDWLCYCGGTSEISINQNNEPIAAYGNDSFRYGHRLNGVWEIEQIGSSFHNAISITSDSMNRPHIVHLEYPPPYGKYGPGDFIYTYYDGTWHDRTIETDKLANSSSICTDSTDYPHILYTISDSRKAIVYRYAYWDPNVRVDDDTPTTPTGFSLFPAYPNPSHGAATIGFALPHTCEVNLDVFDIKGRKVATLVESTLPAGDYERGVSGLSSGVYLYRLAADEFVDTKKMVVK
ncbi:MAG: T9SS type A sorting domain-containing protein [bacterium]|nr:T9SS type A sorting domain-containing protein [bacterium]